MRRPSFWATVVGKAIFGGIFKVVFGEGEGTLSVNSRALNKSTNVVGIFTIDDWMLLIDLAKNTEERRIPFWSGAPAWCQSKTLERENKYPYLKKAENTCVVFSMVIRSLPLS